MKTTTVARLLVTWALLILVFSCYSGCKNKSNKEISTDNITPAEARQIAREAYTYGFPITDNLRVQYAYYTDKSNPEYKGPYNQLFNIPRVFTPEDRIIQTPNSDTPYSWIGLDLRTEPIVFIIPKIDSNRYWSLQLVDLYTFNFDYLGSRSTGNNGGAYMIAGPDWKGEKPAGIDKLIRCETEIASAQFRTQLFNPADLDNVRKLQSQYAVKTLSAFLGKPAPPAAPAINFPKPLTGIEAKTSLQTFSNLNFALQFCPVHPSEKQLMEKFARLNIGAGKTFDTTKISPEILQAMQEGIADSWKDFARVIQETNEGKISPADAFGTREFLNGNYAYRMAAAVAGIYGNSKEEALYPNYYLDAAGKKLDGANQYTMHFPPGQLPPVHSFWSLTMYDSSDLLVANPIHRYLVNSTMLADFKKDPDGGITLYLQHNSPGKNKESNWLPSPEGIFRVVLRLYWPKPEALNGTWKQPPVIRVS